MFQAPLSIYIGKYSINESLNALAIQAIWFVALTLLLIFAQRRATKRVLVQGG